MYEELRKKHLSGAESLFQLHTRTNKLCPHRVENKSSKLGHLRQVRFLVCAFLKYLVTYFKIGFF